MYLFSNADKFTTAMEILINSALNWDVVKVPLMIPKVIQFEDDAFTELSESGSVILLRSDFTDEEREKYPRSMKKAKKENRILGVHNDGYEVFDNQQLAELVYDLSNAIKCPIHSAGELDFGRKVYIQLKTNELNLNGDKVKGFLTAVNSFDGSTSLGFGLSTVTISCANTFNGAYRQMTSKVKHTKNMQIRLDDIMKSYEKFSKDEDKHFELIRKLASAPATKEVIEIIYKVMFKITPDEVVKGIKTNGDEISTRTKNNIVSFNNALTTELNGKGQTMWGQFSGLTRYTTHEISANDTSKMVGTTAKNVQNVLSQISKLV